MEILTRNEFDEVLDEAIARLARVAAVHPENPAFTSLSRQLDAVKEWTAGGRLPTAPEKHRLNMSALAERELSGYDEELALLLNTLHGYVDERMGDPREAFHDAPRSPAPGAS